MNLYAQLRARAASDQPLRVGLIGAGKFGSMYLSQVPRTPGIHLVGIADLAPANARKALKRVGWPDGSYSARSLAKAAADGDTAIVRDSMKLIESPHIDIIIDATGHPSAGIKHVMACCEHGKHIVMVNVEADALAGPILAQKARDAGIVYSLAYGDQPALICEMIDWGRTAGFEIVAAGKGTKYMSHYHQSTPDDVWNHYGISAEDAHIGGMNAQMFNSFFDGTKSAIEMAAVANAADLAVPSDGLLFPACGVDDIPLIMRPSADGGVLPGRGMVEVVTSVERDGRPVFRDLRWGVYVSFAADTDYVRRCFQEYGLQTDDSGNYAAMYKPYHLIGLELGISVASIGLRGESTGQAQAWHGDVVATAKRDLKSGEMLDGEGGYCVYGKLIPAQTSVDFDALPLGLASNLPLKRNIPAGQVLRWRDVRFDANDVAVKVRREMESWLSKPAKKRK